MTGDRARIRAGFRCRAFDLRLPAGFLIDNMASGKTDLNYRVVGIRRDGTRDERYWNLSLLTAEQVRTAMLIAKEYQAVVVGVVAGVAAGAWWHVAGVVCLVAIAFGLQLFVSRNRDNR